jgi:F-type H+-transporting ATPase subunit b
MKYWISTGILFLSYVAQAAQDAHQAAGGEHHEAIPMKLIAYQSINVGAMLIGLAIVLKKPLQSYFREKKASFLSAAQKAESARKSAEEERIKIQTRLEKLESTADESVSRARAEAADMKKQLIAEAEAASKRIRDEAATAAKLEVDRAKIQLREALIKEALELSRQNLASKVTADDHKRLQSDFIQNIQAVQK